MPVYEYKCRACGKEFEIQQRITADALTICPEEDCQGEIYRKISKNVALVFKGSGFYITDYKKKNGTAASSPPVKNSSNGKSNGESKNGSAKTETTATKKETAKASA